MVLIDEIEQLRDELHGALTIGAHLVRPLVEHALSEPERIASARQEEREKCIKVVRDHIMAVRLGDADGDFRSIASAIEHHIRTLSPPTEPVQMDDGWIEWAGGECPVQDGVETHAKTRDGVIGRSLEPRGWCGWQHDPRAPGLDIIAYRIVKPAKED